LQRAGFALPVADRDPITVAYPDAWALMRDLSRMGESNAVRLRAPGPLRRAILAEAGRLYAERHAFEGGRVRATFEILYISGWAPAATQQKPLRPGQATRRLADALGAEERPAGDIAIPRNEQAMSAEDLRVELIPAFQDNYIYLLRNPGSDVVGIVDAGDAAPAIAELDRQGLTLTH